MNVSISAWVERIVRIGSGPLVALTGWSLASFLRTEVDDVAARFSGIAHIVAGALFGTAALAGGPGLAESMRVWALSGAVWLCVGVIALGAVALRHPLFGRTFGLIGVVGGFSTMVWTGYSLPATGGVQALLHPLTLLGVWYIAMLAQTAGAVRRIRRGYAGWPEPALV